MPAPLKIDWSLTGSDKVVSGFASLGKQTSLADRKVLGLGKRIQGLTANVKAATLAYKSLNSQLARYNSLTRQTPTVTIGGSGGSLTPGGGGSRASSFGITGPYQRRLKIARALSLAQGGSAGEKDALLAQSRNDRHIAGLEKAPAGLGGKLMDALKTSRFSLGGGKAELMPLVSKAGGVLAEALGPELAALAGPVGLLAGVSLSAAKGLYDLTKAAAEAGAAYSARGLELGTLGASGGIAGAIGGPDAGSKARSFNDAITGSAMGRMFGMQLGQFNLAGPYGKVDLSGQYIGAMDRLRKMPLNDAIRTARNTGLESSLPDLMMHDKQWNITKQQGAIQTQIMDPEYLRQSADFQQAEKGLTDSLQNLMTAVGKPGMALISDTLNGLAGGINALALATNNPIVQAMMKGMAAIAIGPVGGLLAGGTAYAGNLSGQDKNTAALDKNTEATNKLAGIIPGVYGKDTDGRLANALPGRAGYNGDYRVRQNLQDATYRLGAIG